MAVDTREKRFSMMNLLRFPQTNLFEADGTVDADDRAHLLALYSGIPLGGAPTTTFTTYFYTNLLAGG